MKIFLNKLLILISVSLLMESCDTVDLVELNPNASTTATLSPSNVVLDKANIGQTALDVSWTEPDFGFNAAPSYQILIDLAGGDFSSADVTSTGKDLSYNFETEEFNKILIGLGVEPENETQLDIKVRVLLGSNTNIYSDINTISATAYADALDLSSPWGIVGSAYNDWGNAGPDAPFYKIQGEPGKYVAYVTLIDGDWKIRKDNDWTVNYGDNAGDGNLQQDGANMTVSAGTYKIVFDEAALTYTIESYTWGIVGSAYNDWGSAGPDAPLEYDPYTDTWRTQVKLLEGAMKIRLNNDWGVNYGDDGPDGTLDAGGADIVVSAGYYEIIVDFNDFTYTIEETDIWGVVGSGYNDWGATPDFPFKKDFSKEGVYFIDEITLLDGHIKFRTNNDWGFNYGDTGLDGILEEGGDDIPSVAGVYSIILDLSNPSVPNYTITSK